MCSSASSAQLAANAFLEIIVEDSNTGYSSAAKGSRGFHLKQSKPGPNLIFHICHEVFGLVPAG